jgi:hypothetical protein
MFEDGCLFYTLTNFYREQRREDIFRVEVFVSPVSGRESLAFAFISITYDDSRRHRV